MWDVKKRTKVTQLVQASADGAAVPCLALSRTGEMLAFARGDDWCGGEARYHSLVAGGHKPEVGVVMLPKAAG